MKCSADTHLLIMLQAPCMTDQEENLRMDDSKSTDEKCLICKTDGINLKKFCQKTWNSLKSAGELRLSLKSDRFKAVTMDINLMDLDHDIYYHTACHKNFTAVKRKTMECASPEPVPKKVTRRSVSLPVTDEMGLLRGTCIFCGKSRKTVKKKNEPLSDILTEDGVKAIKAAATVSGNERVKSLVDGNVDFIAKEAQYHKSCRRSYMKISTPCSACDADSSDYSPRDMHNKAFISFSTFLESVVIDEKRPMLVSTIFDLYSSEFKSIGGREQDLESYTKQNLIRKIQHYFEDKVAITEYSSKCGYLLYKSELESHTAREMHSVERGKAEKECKLMEAALYLRTLIQELPKWKTPQPTSVHTLKASSPEIPEEILLFFKTLLCGLKRPKGDDAKESIDRKVLAMSSDAIYATSRGSVKPWKQIVLGLGLGSLAGSKIIIEILNRLGYSLSYDDVKSLETEFAYTAAEKNENTPDGIELKPGEATGLAWDNYDVNLETLDGKNTLHATVGICFQNQGTSLPVSQSDYQPRQGRNRRKFNGEPEDIAPYHKPLSTAKFLLKEPDLLDNENPIPETEEEPVSRTNHQYNEATSSPPTVETPEVTDGASEKEEPAFKLQLKPLDLVWFLISRSQLQPLLAGFCSKHIIDTLPLHTIGYMDPISVPPTENCVVRETMIRSLNVGKETGQVFTVVTYDLAVALKAYAIQSLESPKFDNLLIMLGNFHLEMALFGACGTYMNESGAEYILTESGVLAEGSHNGFIQGKFYNRCSRIHDIFAVALERKLFEKFQSSLSDTDKIRLEQVVNKYSTKEDLDDISNETSNVELHRILNQYETYFHAVAKGSLGPTAQYWCIYIYMVNRVHRELMRSLRTNDVQGYISILPEVITIFFGLNRPNYSRWGSLFLHKLETAPLEARVILEKGALSIRRTKKDFSRTAVDQTLEQTVNRDSASPMRGIVNFQNNNSCIRRWCVTSTQRGMAVTELRNLVGLTKHQQPAAQLTKSRIKKDNADTESLLEVINESCDPFDEPATSSDCLLNLATGKAASDKTKKYLLGVLEEGQKLKEKFIAECQKDDTRFMQKIARRKVENFAKENLKKKAGGKSDRQKVKAESERDLFLRMLVIVSQNTGFDLGHVLTFPITNYPLSIAHNDGSLYKTQKSTLMKKLETFQSGCDEPSNIDVTIIDGGLLIHTYLSVASNLSTYGKLALSLLSHICTYKGREIHVLFDTYRTQSLKAAERQYRGAEDRTYVISGPDQIIKQNGQQLLKNGKFKDQLAIFLIREWQKQHYGPVLQQKILLASYGGHCTKISYCDGLVLTEEPQEIQGEHEEADTLVALHSSALMENYPGACDIMVRASDTDILVILIAVLGRLQMTGSILNKILMDAGSGNNRRFINVNAIAESLEKKLPGMCIALPAIHAFTGSDFTSAFYRKGKVKALDVLEANPQCIDVFKAMSSEQNVEETDFNKASEFVCRLYGIKDTNDVNVGRHTKILQMTGKINQEDPLSKIKKVDCALLPPCQKVLKQKLYRASYISRIWRNAHTRNPTHDIDPKVYGWKLDENDLLVPNWYNGPAVPILLFGGSDSVDVTENEADDANETSVEYDQIDDGTNEWSDESDTE